MSSLRARTLALAAIALTLTACSSEADVSTEGQLEYACGLIADIRENNPKVRDWELRIGDDSPKEMLQAMAAASLVGGATGGGADVSDKMQEAGAQVVRGISMLSEEHIQKGVVEMARQCDAR